MIKKLWVKWDGLDIECMCDGQRRKCVAKPGEVLECKEYVVKFVEVGRSEGEAEKQVKDFGDAVKKFERDLQKRIKQMNKFVR